MKLGILGGTFNPPHVGHLLMAEAGLGQASLDRVLWVPDRQPPHRSSAVPLPYRQRCEMTQRAIAPHPHFELAPAWEAEIDSAAPSYAIDTLHHLQRQSLPQPGLNPPSNPKWTCGSAPSVDPLVNSSAGRDAPLTAPTPTLTPASSAQWFWILGLDAFESLPRWYRFQEVVPQCQWLVVPRAIAAAPAANLQRRAIAVVETLQQSGLAVDWRWVPMPQIAISSSLIRRYCCDRRSIRYLVPDAVRTYIEQNDLYRASQLEDDLD